MPRRTTADHIARRIGLHTALGRYGFTVLAALALLNHLLWPALITGSIAAYAWRNR